MKFKESKLSKGHLRKLKAMRNSISLSIGAELGVPAANKAFEEWYHSVQAKSGGQDLDPVAGKIKDALKPYLKDKSFSLGNKGYKITRSKGKGAKGFKVIKL